MKHLPKFRKFEILLPILSLFLIQTIEAAPVYIANFSNFPAYPYNTSSYMQSGQYVGCGPTTGAMMMRYFHYVEGLPSATGLLTNPGTGVNEGLNTAWELHTSQYMATQANGFGSVYNIEPGLEDYASDRGYKIKVVIHASPTYDPNSSDADWLNDYGPYGDSWLNDGDFWVISGGWNIDANKFCDFVAPRLAAGIAIFLTIDTNEDRSGDHWVALVGYDRATLKYAFYDTYRTSVQWADIYYCNPPGATKDNSISMLRSVEYIGPIQQPVEAPTDLVALNGYHGRIPLAWNAPAGVTTRALPAVPKNTEVHGGEPVKNVAETEASNILNFGSVLANLPGLNSSGEAFEFITRSPAGFIGYNVYRSTSSGGPFSKIANQINRQYYSDNSATNGQKYYYRATAVYNEGESDPSNIVNATAQTNGYVVESGWAISTPSIDGVIKSIEWEKAQKVNITYPGYTGTVTLYVMNDNAKLYLAVDDTRDNSLENLDQFAFFFDENFDQAWPSSATGAEGIIWVAWDLASGKPFTAFGGRYGYWPNNIGLETNVTTPAVTHGMSLASGNVQYEAAYDLINSPFNAKPGYKAGFLVFTYDYDPSYFNAFWPQEVERLNVITPYISAWGTAPFSFGTMILATQTVSQPDIAADPASWIYGSVTVGSYAERTFKISNEGTANLNVTATTLTGTNAGEFSIPTGGGAFTLAAGTNRSLTIRFSPTGAGSKTATLSIASNDPDENPFTISLSGSGVAAVPDISVTPTVIDFGSTAVGTFVEKSVVVKNDGSGTLNISATSLTGTNATDFSIQSGGGAFSLAPGATQNILLRFKPAGGGSRGAALSITSNDPDENPLLVDLKGSGLVVLQPDISAIPTALDFGSVTIGGWQEGTVSIKNDGAAPLSVSATNLTGANAGEFTIPSGGGAFSLAAGATRNITLRLTPTTPGNKIAALNITSNDPDENPLVVNLTGIGAGAGILIMPTIANPQQMAGAEFIVSIEVGSNANPVTDLFGVSFQLNYSNTNYVQYQSSEAGAFIGSDVIFFPTADDPNGKVSIGISRKSGQGGVNGFGSIAKIKFTTEMSTPHNTLIDFMISDVSANNSTGDTIVLTPGALKVTILAGVLVWPGDTNNSGLVDQADILPLGLHWGKTGPARQGASSAWTGQLASPWTPQPATFADATGDGTVNQADVLPIGLNWSKTHTLLSSETPSPEHPSKAGQSQQLTVQITGETNPNQDFFIDIIGNNLVNVLGISFELIYTPVSVTQLVNAEVGPDNILGTAPIFFQMINGNFGADSGKVSVGISRKFNEGGVNGTGRITRLTAHMAASAIPKISQTQLTLINVQANDPVGNPITLEVIPFSLTTRIESGTMGTATDFVLYSNYPNPFNPGTTISFNCPQPSAVTLTIYDLQGQQVRQLVHQDYPSGRQQTYWDGRDDAGKFVAAGIYFYQLEAKSLGSGQRVVAVKKMMLVK